VYIVAGFARYRRNPAIMETGGTGAALARADTPVADTPVANPGMEPPYNAVNLNGGAISGSLANGWSENSAWANPTVQYSEETNNPHSGLACQKGGRDQRGHRPGAVHSAIPLQAGNIYTASVWLRGTPGLQASLVIQQANSPYATYIQSSLALTADWQQLTATGYITTTEPRVSDDRHQPVPGTVWADDFALSFAPGTIAPTPRIGPIPLSFFGMHVENFCKANSSTADSSRPMFRPASTIRSRAISR
jgi:hypothetical protein